MNEVRNLSFSYNTQALHRLTLYPAVCCAETALALLDALRSAKTGGAPPLPAGFTTPAHAVGDALAARLKAVKGACIETVCA